jgi:hypothetical protein
MTQAIDSKEAAMNVSETLDYGLERVSKWLQYAAFAVGAVTTVVALGDFVSLTWRTCLYIVLVVLFVTCAFLRVRKASPIGFDPNINGQQIETPRNFWWLVLAGLSLVVMICDWSAHSFRAQSLAIVSDIKVGMGDTTAVLQPKQPAIQFADVRPEKSAAEAPSQFNDWLSAPEEKRLAYIMQAASVYVDDSDARRPMTESEAAELYASSLCDHFGFRVHKNPNVAEVFVEDIRVTVHNFIACLPTGAPSFSGGDHRDIIVVELSNPGKVPRDFHPKFFLDDPQEKTVTPWNRKSIRLRDNLERTFLVKIGARDPGIYVYTVQMTLRSGDGSTQVIPLLTEKRAVVHYGDTGSPLVRRFWDEVNGVETSASGTEIATPSQAK